jgi:hypothetical protein
MALIIDLTPEQEAALEAEAHSRGMALPDFARLRLLETLPQEKTWGERAIEKWRQAAILGEYGDMSKDSPEFSRELRARVEADLFRKTPQDADAA